MKKYLSSADATSNVVWIDDDAAPLGCFPKSTALPDRAESTIGELSREFGVTLRSLRFYENKGLISPRRVGNARLYSRTDRSRLALILMGKKLGFTLAEIASMISAGGGTPQGDGLRLTKEKCLEQIRLLEQQQVDIRDALAELWRIYAGLAAEITRIDRQEQVAEAGTAH
jgi:DNA-binding transcriptional MerR regulator